MYTPLRPQSTPHSVTPSCSPPHKVRHDSSHTAIVGANESIASTSEDVVVHTVPPHAGHPSQRNGSVRACKDAQATANVTWSQDLGLDHLDFSRLDNFEIVDHQYRNQGVQFRNAIALHPSNPAFPPRTSQTILLGAPKNGTIELVFPTPVHTVEGYVTASGVTTLTAFDHQGKIVGTDETLGRNLADDQSKYEPNARLFIQSTPSSAIYCIRLRCGGGQLALSDLSFSRISD